MKFNNFKDAMQHMAKNVDEAEITTEGVEATRKSSINTPRESVRHGDIDYKFKQSANGYVDYGTDGSSFLYQVVPSNPSILKKELDLTPALKQIFSGVQGISITEPEPDFPAWTVRLENILLNPWMAERLTSEYLDQVSKLLD